MGQAADEVEILSVDRVIALDESSESGSLKDLVSEIMEKISDVDVDDSTSASASEVQAIADRE
eukprot:1958903-Prorocentrum_lima.AAC.1